MSAHNDQTVRYFAEKAEKYDDVDSQAYWAFSDSFYKEVLKRELKAFFDTRKNVRLLDAGAGTGRWTLFLDEMFGATSDISGVLLDVSSDMLAVADRKIVQRGLSGKYLTQIGDIEDLAGFEDD